MHSKLLQIQRLWGLNCFAHIWGVIKRDVEHVLLHAMVHIEDS